MTIEEALKALTAAVPNRTPAKYAQTEDTWYFYTENKLNYGKNLPVIENGFYAVKDNSVLPITPLDMPGDLSFVTVPLMLKVKYTQSKDKADGKGEKMEEQKKINLRAIKDAVIKGTSSIDLETAKQRAVRAGEIIGENAGKIKDSAVAMKDDITEKLTLLDRMLETSVTEYNDAFTLMNDKGIQLFIERTRSVDTISFVENLVNSIANRPKAFDADFEEIRLERDKFLNTCDFGERELKAAREAAYGAGAGLAAGASAAFMAPTAAMWIATTFGTASTGTAISTLSGAAATNAALAWLGGGALATGGGGVAAGNALLAMAGPIGWTIAGATLLTSILLFTTKKAKLNKQKNEEIEAVKSNTEKVREMDAKIKQILEETVLVRNGLNNSYTKCLPLIGKDYSGFSEEQKASLGALVNQTKALSALFEKTVA